MKIQVKKDGIRVGQLSKLMIVGYLFGLGPLFIVMTTIMMFTNPGFDMPNGQSLQLFMLSTIPVLMVLQGAMMAVVLSFGLWVFKRFSKIQFEMD